MKGKLFSEFKDIPDLTESQAARPFFERKIGWGDRLHALRTKGIFENFQKEAINSLSRPSAGDVKKR